MATNLNIDTALLENALKIGGFRTKREAVNRALREFIRLTKQKKLLSYFGTVEFDSGYSYKKERSR